MRRAGTASSSGCNSRAIPSSLRQIRFEKAILAGFDWGARSADVVAALWPDRCRGLVSVSGYLIGSQAAGAVPLPPPAEHAWWYLFYFATDRGRVGYEKYRREFIRLIWRLASPEWAFDDATFARSVAAFDNPLPGRIEASFLRRVQQLPAATQRLLLVAAAEPTGEPALLWRAAGMLGIPAEAVGSAEADGLLDLGVQVAFRHPLLRSAIYRAAEAEERRSAHRALAVATDAETDPGRRAWHRAHRVRKTAARRISWRRGASIGADRGQ